MADGFDVGPEDRQAIARQVSRRLALASLVEGRRTGLDLGEAFRVFTLRLVDIGQARRIRSLRAYVKALPVVQFQVREEGRAVISAQVSRSGDEWEVGSLFGATLAPEIQTTITWIDKNLTVEGEARLLMVPEVHVVAFWVAQGSRERLVPVGSRAGDAALRLETAYTPQAFLTALRTAS